MIRFLLSSALILSIFGTVRAFAAEEFPNMFCVSRLLVAYTDAKGTEELKVAAGGNLDFYKGYMSQAVPQHPEVSYWVNPMGLMASQNGGKMDYRFDVASDINNNRISAEADLANSILTYGYDDKNYYGFPNPQLNGKPNVCKLTSIYVYCAADLAHATAAADEFFKVQLPAIPDKCGALE